MGTLWFIKDAMLVLIGSGTAPLQLSGVCVTLGMHGCSWRDTAP